jgi:hypothetical protein
MKTFKMLITINGIDVHFGGYGGQSVDIIDRAKPYLELFDSMESSAKICISIKEEAKDE